VPAPIRATALCLRSFHPRGYKTSGVVKQIARKLVFCFQLTV
jgi:hypothetical protein